MKRLFVCAAVAASMLIPAEAIAASTPYSGTADADPAATITFKIKQRQGVTKFANPSLTNFPATCTAEDGVSDPQQQRINVAGRGAVPVVRKKFNWRATEPYVSTTKVKGKLGAGGVASGTAEFFGTIQTASGPRYCETGIVAWSAARG